MEPPQFQLSNGVLYVPKKLTQNPLVTVTVPKSNSAALRSSVHQTSKKKVPFLKGNRTEKAFPEVQKAFPDVQNRTGEKAHTRER